jgi:tetratricopeptide (TPR) repeat protein
MLLRRHTNNFQRSALVLLMALVLGACASSGPMSGSSAGTGPAGASSGSSSGEQAPFADVPRAALTLFEQATASMASGDLLDAELRFKEFLLQYPDYPGAYVNLAIIHSNNANETAARAAIDRALALDASHPAALNQLGMLLRKNGNFLEAEAAYMKAVTVSPEYALAHYNLGVLYELYLQRLDKALQHFAAYQSIVGDDKQVEKWINDLTRRVAASQPTADVAE